MIQKNMCTCRKGWNDCKKAQVTYYLILGIIILALIGIFAYYKLHADVERSELAVAQEEVPTEFKAAQTYFTQCVEEISKEGILKLGLNGGYIDPLNSEYTLRTMEYNEAEPTDSDMVPVPGMNIVPYWYHMVSPNKCEMTECYTDYNFPTIEEVEYQLALYVGKNIGKCIDLFVEVADTQGYTVSPKQIPVTVARVNNYDFSVLLYYPIEITKEGRQHTLNYFFVKHNVDFGKIYTAGLLLSHSEGTNRYLEKILKLVLSNYQGADFDLLPPFNHETTGPMAVSWSQDLVKLRIMDILTAYTPLIRVQHADNAEEYTSEKKVLNNIYEYSMITNPYNFSNMEIRYYYLNWPIYLDINPKAKDGSLKPDVEETERLMSTTLIRNKYNFKYDIAFPVVVEIRDKNAFDKQGYSLFFALEGNIKNNEDIFSYMLQYPLNPALPDDLFTIEGYDPAQAGTTNIPESSAEENAESTFNSEASSSFDANGNPLPPPTAPEGSFKTVELPNIPASNIFCNPNQKIGPEVSFKVTDAQTGDPVKDVVVFYKCGPFYSCRIASSDEKGLAKGKIPLCETGAFKFEKYPYINYYYKYDSKKDKKGDAVSVEIYKPFEKKFRLKMINVDDLETYVDDSTINNQNFAHQFKREYAYEEIGADATIMVMLNRRDTNAYSDTFVRSYKIDTVASTAEGTMELIPAEYGTGAGYDVKILYINNSEHLAKGSGEYQKCCKTTIDASGKESESCTDEDGEDEDSCAEENKRFDKYNPQLLNKTMQGMTDISEESTKYVWHIDYDDLTDPEKDTVVFYILKISLPEYTEDLQEMTDVQKKSGKYRHFILPEIISSKDAESQFTAAPSVQG